MVSCIVWLLQIFKMFHGLMNNPVLCRYFNDWALYVQLYFIFLTVSTSMVLPVCGYMENEGMNEWMNLKFFVLNSETRKCSALSYRVYLWTSSLVQILTVKFIVHSLKFFCCFQLSFYVQNTFHAEFIGTLIL